MERRRLALNVVVFVLSGADITVDQPLYTLAKQIQWSWPASHREDQFVVMIGGLHIEIAAHKALGDLLESSGWTGALIQASLATPGTADSF